MKVMGMAPGESSPSFLFSAREGVLAGMACLFLSSLYLWDAIGSDRVFMSPVLGFFFIPLRQLWIDEVLHLTFPLWNPFSLAGTPLFATLQPAVLYPFSLLYFFLPFYFTFNFTIVIHYGLAGGFMYCLMRGQKCSREAACVSALTFMLGGYLLSVHQYPSTLFPAAWVPLLLLCYFSGLPQGGYRRAVLAGMVGVLILFSGGLEVCYMTFPFLATMTLFPGLFFYGKDCGPLPRRLSYLAWFVLAFSGLSAVQLLPTLELAGLSTRSGGMAEEAALVYAYGLKDMIQFFLVDPFNYGRSEVRFANPTWLTTVYMGMIPFVLSLFYFSRKGLQQKMFLLIVLVSLVLSLGKAGYLFTLFREYVPLFDTIRFPVKFIFPAIIVLAMSAGWGFDIYRTAVESHQVRGAAWARGFLFLGFVLMLLFGVLEFFHDFWMDWMVLNGLGPPDFNTPQINLFNLKRLLVFTSLFGLCLFLYWKLGTRGKSFLVLAILVFATDLFFANRYLLNLFPVERYERAGDNMKFILSDPSLFRIYITPETRGHFMSPKLKLGEGGNYEEQMSFIRSQLGTPHRIYDVGGRVVMRPARMDQVNAVLDVTDPARSKRVLDMLNVKYAISVPKLEPSHWELVHIDGIGSAGQFTAEQWESLETARTIKIYRNIDHLPRAFLVDGCREVRDEGVWPLLFNEKYDPVREILLEKSPAELPCGGGNPPETDDAESVVIDYFKSSSVQFTVRAAAKKFLFLSESYFPGWKAWLNDRPVPIYRANFAFRAVVVEPGEHKVRFEYHPLSFRLGGLISLISLLAAGVGLIRKSRGNPVAQH